MKRSNPILLSLCSVVVTGCGGSVSDRHPLHGTVRVDGVAIKKGSIIFLPMRDTPGTPATALIVQGEYRFTPETGPYAGRHRVVVGADPNQRFAANTQRSIPDRNQTSTSDVQPGSMGSVKLAPAGPGEVEQFGDPRRSRPVPIQESNQARLAQPDPARNQWEIQFNVIPELTLRQDFEFVTSSQRH